MKEYHKIQTVYLRNPEDNFKTLLLGQYALPEFAYLANNEWVFTEKNATAPRITGRLSFMGTIHHEGQTSSSRQWRSPSNGPSGG